MNNYLRLILMIVFFSGIQNVQAQNHIDNYYANISRFEMDPNLPEPFSRTKSGQIILNFEHQDITLYFLMSESEGINVTFPITSDTKDSCNNRKIIATPPPESTPYYQDFEIQVIDYSQNKCDNLKIEAPTFASLKSFEVRKNVKTLSHFYAEQLKVSPNDQ